jgi:hypothetical protein
MAVAAAGRASAPFSWLVRGYIVLPAGKATVIDDWLPAIAVAVAVAIAGASASTSIYCFLRAITGDRITMEEGRGSNSRA